jgi:hypothetical protein
MKAGTFVYQDLWYTRGVAIKAISPQAFTPNFNGVHTVAGGGAKVVGGLCDSNGIGSNGRGIAIAATGACAGPVTSGTIEVTFATPTSVVSAELSGMCNSMSLQLKSGAVEVVNIDPLSTSGGPFQINKTNVVKISVVCVGAGALEEISYVLCPIDGCPMFHLDFSDLVQGQYISDEWKDSKGVIIEAIPDGGGFTPSRSSGYVTNSRFGGGAARTFNTGNNIEDIDLGTPNRDFGGPGLGCGGGKFVQRQRRNSAETCQSWAGTNGIPVCNPNCIYTRGDGVKALGGSESAGLVLNPYVNDKAIGNVIIIQESNKVNPDDSVNGGWINFYFDPPASLEKIRILDIDTDGRPPGVTITYSDTSGRPNDQFTLIEAGDNGYLQREIFALDVIKLSIFYQQTGSVAELHYGSCPFTNSSVVQNWVAGDEPLH